MSEQNKNNEQKIKEEPKKESAPFWTNIIIIMGVLLVLWQTLVRGSGAVSDYIVQVLGGLTMTAFLAFAAGLIPYLVLKRHFHGAKQIVFSASFLLISIITFLGTLYRN